MMIKHPLQAISLKSTSILVVIFAVFTLSIAIQLDKIGQPLTISGILPQGILSLEFAFTAKNAQAIVKAWSNANVLKAAIDLQRLDFIFIFAYSTTLSLSCLWVTKLLLKFDPRWLSAGIVLAWGQWLAALFDITENLCLFPFLDRATENLPLLALVAAISAGLKFILIGLGIAYCLISVFIKIRY
jgi:hypothetical protein